MIVYLELFWNKLLSEIFIVSLPKWFSACLHRYYVSATFAVLSWDYVFVPSAQGFHVITIKCWGFLSKLYNISDGSHQMKETVGREETNTNNCIWVTVLLFV